MIDLDAVGDRRPAADDDLRPIRSVGGREGELETGQQVARIAIQVRPQDRAGVGLVDDVALVGVDRPGRVLDLDVIAIGAEPVDADDEVVGQDRIDDGPSVGEQFALALDEVQVGIHERVGDPRGESVALLARAGRVRLCLRARARERLDVHERVVGEDRDEVGVGLEEEVPFRADPLGLAVAAEDEGVAAAAGPFGDPAHAVDLDACVVHGERRLVAEGSRWQDVQVDPEQDRRARELQQLHGASPSMTVRQPLAAERWTASRKAM